MGDRLFFPVPCIGLEFLRLAECGLRARLALIKLYDAFATQRSDRKAHTAASKRLE